MSAFYCLCPEEWYDVHSHFIDENSPGGSDGEEYACDVGDPGSIPGLGRSLEEGNGYPLHYFCLENSMDRGAWQATIHGVTKSQTPLKQLSMHAQSHIKLPGEGNSEYLDTLYLSW